MANSPPLLQGFDPTLLLVLNLAGTFVFGLSGGMAGVRAQLDLFGAIVLAAVVGLAGGIIRDLLIGIPPATFRDWRYLAVVGAAGLVTSLAHPAINRLARPILALDAAGLALFCVTGATKSLEYGLGIAPAIILGAVTGVGGGTIRDVLVRRVPTVLTSGLYAIPALVGAVVAVIAVRTGFYGIPAAIGAALACFLIRAVGIRYHLNAPVAPEAKDKKGPGQPTA